MFPIQTFFMFKAMAEVHELPGSPSNLRDRGKEYSRHWEQGGKLVHNDDEARGQRKAQYTTITNEYYDNTTDIYIEAWGQSFHFCHYPRGREPKATAIARHEHYLALMMGLRPGMRILDVGCGVGGPAKEIATFVGCTVVGLNNNGYQVKKAKELATKDGMEKMVEFVIGDFMDIPFPSDSFDAVFAIDATVHAPSLTGVYSEIYRVLKPGGVFGVFEWVLTNKFSPDDSEHMAVRLGIERGNGVAALQDMPTAQAAMKNAGFDLVITEDLAERPARLPWWYHICGDTKSAQGFQDWMLVLRNTKYGRYGVKFLVSVLEFVRFAPKGTLQTTEELIKGADALALGGKKGLFTPMYLMVGKAGTE